MRKRKNILEHFSEKLKVECSLTSSKTVLSHVDLVSRDIFTGTHNIHHRPCCSRVNLPACCFCQTVDERLVLADNELTIFLQNQTENELITNEKRYFTANSRNHEKSVLTNNSPTVRSSIFFLLSALFHVH